jgi:hypothetical protein
MLGCSTSFGINQNFNTSYYSQSASHT